MRPPRCLRALPVALALAASGCGGSASTTATTVDTNPIAHIPESPPATSGTTTPDEQQVRVPATFTITASGLRPHVITVPPFIAVELAAIAADGHDHILTLATSPPTTLTLQGGTSAGTRIRGLRAGRYAVTLDGHGAGALVAGGEVGP